MFGQNLVFDSHGQVHILCYTYYNQQILQVEPRYCSQYKNQAKGWLIRLSNFEWGKRFSFLQNVQTGSGVQPTTCSKGKESYTAGDKFPGDWNSSLTFI
jgi:hypothetical protein